MPGPNAWRLRYRARQDAYEQLCEELLFSLRRGLVSRGVKIHSLTARVKSEESLAEKAKRKAWVKPVETATDIVGARVVVLFLSDLPAVAEIVHELFDVIRVEDLVEGPDPSAFGYMSQHFDARIASQHSGPRYDELKDIVFEIQVRTILMDAWANVSHHLAYKNESSIPEELRRDFSALSGLFYVADKHFELFFSRSGLVETDTERQLDLSGAGELALNLETLVAFLRKRYADREHAERSAVAELLSELLESGYADLAMLERDLEGIAESFEAYEATQPPTDDRPPYGPTRYSDVGAVRRSLTLSNPVFRKVRGALEEETT